MEDKLKVFLFCNRGHGSVALQTCLDLGIEITGICTKLTQESYSNTIKFKIDRLLRSLSLRKPGGFIYKDPFDSFIEPTIIARKHGVKVFYDKEVKSKNLYDFILQSHSDLILSCSFNRLVPKTLLNCVDTAINIHPGVLPLRAGGTPNRWAICLGDAETAITAHIMTEKFDEGNILNEIRIPIRQNATWGDVELLIATLIPKAIRSVVGFVQSRNVLGTPQQSYQGTLPSFNGKYQVIDWFLSSDQIKRMCLAMRPKSGALTTINNTKICIWDLERWSMHRDNPIGKILGKDSCGNPIVQLSDCVISITKIIINHRIKNGSYLFRRKFINIGDYFESKF